MKTLPVRDRPRAEAIVEVEGEIVITRASKPVARLVRFVAPRKARALAHPGQPAALAGANRRPAVRGR